MEFAERAIPYNAQHKYTIEYKGKILESYYKPDFICFGSVVVELKALSRLGSIEESQLINYLKVTGHETGLLINFGSRSLEKRRFLWTPDRNLSRLSQ